VPLFVGLKVQVSHRVKAHVGFAANWKLGDAESAGMVYNYQYPRPRGDGKEGEGKQVGL
jgi:hypothetical protein